jgi:endosialidase-like protein
MNNKFLPRAVLFIIAFVISHVMGIGFLQSARAVAPPPDGGYPGFNTAEGQNALFSLTSGVANTAVGWLSLKTDATANFNTGVGAGTLLFNTADSNTATGAAALFNNTTGDGNVANGAFALLSNTTAGGNTAVGFNSLRNDTGCCNTAVGWSALLSNTTGEGNTATGVNALNQNTTAINNSGLGWGALRFNQIGNDNTAVGLVAGQSITGSFNICIGSEVWGVSGENNTIRIGDNLPTGTGQSACYIGGIYGQIASSQAVFVDSTGKLGAQVSSRRFKEEIKQMDEASQALFALTPVSFRYKKEIDPTGRAQFGLVAEDVAKVSPDLVISDKEGKPYTVRYDQVNAMLLNEFLKEHKAFVEEQRKVQQQGTTIARLEQQVEALTAGLQKVSTQLELNKAAPRTVLNNQP